jgi:hypothetical protein
MSTQSYAPDRQATSQQADGQQITSQPTSQKGTGPSSFQIWAAVIGTAVLAGLVVLAVGLWHGQPNATPATQDEPNLCRTRCDKTTAGRSFGDTTR